MLITNPLKSVEVPGVGEIPTKGLLAVIGPNSSGKSQLLKDIEWSIVGAQRELVVCTSVEISVSGAPEQFLDLLCSERLLKRVTTGEGIVSIECGMPHGGSIEQAIWSTPELLLRKHQTRAMAQVGQSDTQPATAGGNQFLAHVGRFFVSALFLARRLTLASTVDSYDFQRDIPRNEMQALYLNRDARSTLCAEIVGAFNKAIWLDPTRGGKLCLRVAENGVLPTPEERLEPEEMLRHRLIEEEGDGIRSYVGTCLALLAGTRPVRLIDEPELCLHPPQAYSLGRFIGKHGIDAPGVTLVATHSSHVLRGMLDARPELEIIRLTRRSSKIRGMRLPAAEIADSVAKPTARVESVLDGLFAESVTIVESENDRLVYGQVWAKVVVDQPIETHFVSVGGTGGIAEPSKLYRRLGIPISVIADLDLLADPKRLLGICAIMCPKSVQAQLTGMVAEVNSKLRPLGTMIDEATFKNKLEVLVQAGIDLSDAGRRLEVKRQLDELRRGLSRGALLRLGVVDPRLEALRGELQSLIELLGSHGVFVVPNGELENWVPGLTTSGPSKRRKAEWATFAANKIRESVIGEGDIWAFVKKVAEHCRKS